MRFSCASDTIQPVIHSMVFPLKSYLVIETWASCSDLTCLGLISLIMSLPNVTKYWEGSSLHVLIRNSCI